MISKNFKHRNRLQSAKIFASNVNKKIDETSDVSSFKNVNDKFKKTPAFCTVLSEQPNTDYV